MSDIKQALDNDAAELKKMGYEQELNRHMGGFSNFAISFSIICILAGGISAFNQGLGAGGGFALGVGWPVGGLFALIVAMAMAQIASAYPTAGGLYHWGSILGGKGFGWTTAWFNLLGLIFVVASVNFGVYDPFFKTLIAPMLGIAPETMAKTINLGFMELNTFQSAFIAFITIIQAILNAYLPKLTTKLTDISGYLIFAVATALVVSLLAYTSTPIDFSKLFTFTNFTGTDGSVWPKQEGFLLPFLSGLLFVTYTITGFDASAHTSEETRDAANNVPKGIIKAVIYSAIFGFIMVCTFVLVMPNLADGVKQGYTFFDSILHQLPDGLRVALSIGIFVSNFLCGLACLTSCSRMMFAFSRDGGLPLSSALRTINENSKTPVVATWVCATLAIAATLYGDAFLVLATGSAVFLYISYVMPTAAGLLAEGKTWKHKGPFNLGGISKLVGILAVIGGSLLAYVGMQPPNQKVFYLTIAMLVIMALFWFVFGERNRFKGPPSVKD
jgi:amino acid transporter